jgi:trigger factor
MKRVIVFSIIIAVLLCAVSGCSVKKTEIYYAYDSFDRFITVGQYSTEVNTESLDFHKYKQEYVRAVFGDKLSAKITSGTVERWDTANINYICRKDGKEVDGGIEMNYSVNVGFGYFGIDAFEEKLVGAPIGKTHYFDIVIDDDYFIKEVAGQEVQFEVFVNFVERNRKPTDEEAVQAGFDSADAFEKVCHKHSVSLALFNAIYDATTVVSCPEKETAALLDSTLAFYQRECDKEGITLEQKAEGMGFTFEEFKDKITEGIQKNYTNMPRDLVSNYILKICDSPLNKEDINNTKKDIIREIDTTLEEAGYSEIEIQRRAAYEKALNVLYEKFG